MKKSLPLPPLVVFGAADPEAELAEKICRQLGVPAVHAIGKDGKRVMPAGAYAPDNVTPLGLSAVPTVVLFECAALVNAARIVVCDHHRPGDPGFGWPPADFWPASSLGQLCEFLGRDGWFGSAWKPTPQMLICAAADHCLAAAYRGECPGVIPTALMRWRAETRAKFQNRPVGAVLADVEAAAAALREAVGIIIARDGIQRIADMRRAPPYPELPEAATRLGMAYIAGPIVDRDGRRKYTGSGNPAEIAAIMSWMERQGMTEIYGDPARGFCGGYSP